MYRTLLVIGIIGTIIFAACNKVDDFQVGIVDENQLEVKSTDSVSFTMTTVAKDPFEVFMVDTVTNAQDNLVRSKRVLLGNLIDPVFGKTKTEAYIQYRPRTSPNFQGATLDSIVFTMAYDSISPGYGNYLKPQNFRIYELAEDFPKLRFNSDQKLAIGNEVGSFSNFVPNPKKVITAIDSSAGKVDTIKFYPHIRTKLSADFGNKLMAIDSVDYTDIDLFKSAIKGLAIVPDNSFEGLLYLQPENTVSLIRLYYTKDGKASSFAYVVSAGTKYATHFETDISGSRYEKGLTSPDDSLSFIRGMAGSEVQITFDDLDKFKNKNVNKAFITFQAKSFDQALDSSFFKPIPDLYVYELREDGTERLITDVRLFKDRESERRTFFKGFFEQRADNEYGQYEMNITNHFHNMIIGNATNKIILRSKDYNQSVNRTILFNQNSKSFAPKMKVIYTNQ